MTDDWQTWASLALTERSHLPAQPGIYIVADHESTVWYVGQAIDLKTRWLGRGHHRYPQLIRTNRKLAHRIYWQLVPLHQLDAQEHFYIDQLEPELNGQKVKQYLPKEPQVLREIKRLLKALNKPTLLFPDVRSVVLGEYFADDDSRSVLVLVSINDLGLIDKSARKRNAPKVRNAWAMIEQDCGQDETKYIPCQIPTYRFLTYRVEFIEVPEFRERLRDSKSLRESFLSTVELFGVPIQALNNLGCLSEIDLPLAYTFSRLDGRQPLRQSAYLAFRQSALRPLPESSRSQVVS